MFNFKVSFRSRILFILPLFLLSACEEEIGGDLNIELTSLSKTSVGVKSSDSRELKGCVIIVNGGGGFTYKPDRASFKKGESRVFSLTRFTSASRRKFDGKKDEVSSVSVSCSNPNGSTVVYDRNRNLGKFLN